MPTEITLPSLQPVHWRSGTGKGATKLVSMDSLLRSQDNIRGEGKKDPCLEPSVKAGWGSMGNAKLSKPE